MGAWYFSLAISLALILIGLYTHWSITLLGAMLPLAAVLLALLKRRIRRSD